LIASFENDAGNIMVDRFQKAYMIWEAFKDRLGKSEFSGIQFNLDSIIQTNVDLNSLVTPFSREEIDYVVKSLPSDKAPGPDGFNTDFVKRCWSIISEEISTGYVMISILWIFTYKASMAR
jgi:hypothetical protein